MRCAKGGEARVPIGVRASRASLRRRMGLPHRHRGAHAESNEEPLGQRRVGEGPSVRRVDGPGHSPISAVRRGAGTEAVAEAAWRAATLPWLAHGDRHRRRGPCGLCPHDANRCTRAGQSVPCPPPTRTPNAHGCITPPIYAGTVWQWLSSPVPFAINTALRDTCHRCARSGQ